MRESGFYWVQFNVGDWRVAYWTDYAWQVGAAAGYWDDEDLIEIDEHLIKRGSEQQRGELLSVMWEIAGSTFDDSTEKLARAAIDRASGGEA